MWSGVTAQYNGRQHTDPNTGETTHNTYNRETATAQLKS